MNGNSRVVGVAGALCMLASASGARANGLVFEGEGAAPALATLQSLAIDAELDERTARVTETRRYALPYAPTASGARALRFHRSLPATADAEVVELQVAGVAREGELLAVPAGDDAREALAVALHDSAPLRELGSQLYVAELSVPAAQTSLEIRLTTRLPARAFGTLRGVALPLDWSKQPIADMRVDVRAATDAPLRVLYSPYHALALSRTDARAATGHYQGFTVCTELDLVLLSSSGDEPIRLDLLPFRRSPDEGGYFLALLSPPLEVDDAGSGPRDIAIALDVSGSMQGEKLASAKDALRSVLSGLRAEDAIALVTFNDVVSHLQPSVEPAGDETLDRARSYVDELVADGGTNIHDAVLAALRALPSGRGRPRYVVLITDGLPTAGPTGVEEIVTAVKARNEIGARVFTFGVGDDVNTVLLDRLAADSGGAASYIRAGESIATVVDGFFQQIRDPVLTDPELDLGALAAADLHPATLPDLFAGQQLSVLGRFDFAGETTVALRGLQRGEPSEQRFTVRIPEQDLDNAYAARIWALRHVGTLLEAIKQGSTDPALATEVDEVARRFGVVTEFTRLITDTAGNSQLSYQGVPTDAVGAVAVNTSTTLSGYTSGGSVSAQSNDGLRYFADRSLIWRDGYYTDTSLDGKPGYVDLVFGSERYFELARREAAFGAAGLLSAHPSVRFELLGRAFRISEEVAGEANAESELPPPAFMPATGTTEVRWLPRPDDPDDANEPDAPEESTTRSSYGCALVRSGTTAAAVPIAAGVALGLLAWLRRRRRVSGPPAA